VAAWAADFTEAAALAEEWAASVAEVLVADPAVDLVAVV
jgi:hypothetical protein